MKDYLATIVENKEIATGICSVTFQLPEKANVRCGQFVDIDVGGTHLLRRPIAICKAEGDKVTFCYQVKGEGTQKLKTMGAGTQLNVLMPLGNGFYVEENEQKIALVGCGVGIFPLISVLREYYGKKQISAYMGFRNRKAVCGLDEFRKADKFVGVTDDGSYGKQGFVTDALPNAYDSFCTCGPEPMLKAVYSATKTSGLFSFEERMGCGFGACMGCSCKTKYGNKRICKDGPVLVKEEIIW
jgi:dihydroorotate dehydrogenase electron transfer subunit